ncbi:MAG: SMC-Scp complex subunit ScpB, partial [Candidatus Marsarchaeota archaeon]|nr:SMC-Scp complex subunit ScpB [Candidatus Marsarchaeota archaeon]
MARSRMSVYVKPLLQEPAEERQEEKAEGKKPEKTAMEASPAPAKASSRHSKASPRRPRAPPQEEPVPDSTSATSLQTLLGPLKEEKAGMEAETPGPFSKSPVPILPQTPEAGRDAASAQPYSPQEQASSSSMPASMLEPLRVLEAALFMSGSGMPAAELGKLVGIGAVGHVSGLLNQLAAQYEQSGSSLEVVEENPGKWAMRIRASFAPAVRRFAGEAEIPR